jgi:hypothetical protein
MLDSLINRSNLVALNNAIVSSRKIKINLKKHFLQVLDFSTLFHTLKTSAKTLKNSKKIFVLTKDSVDPPTRPLEP